MLGSRVSWYDYSYTSANQAAFTNLSIANAPSTMHETGEVTPYAGIVYDLSREWAVYASYTDVFEPQTARTASGSVLKPVIGTNYEVGLKGELMDGRVNTSLAMFRYDQEKPCGHRRRLGFRLRRLVLLDGRGESSQPGDRGRNQR